MRSLRCLSHACILAVATFACGVPTEFVASDSTYALTSIGSHGLPALQNPTFGTTILAQTLRFEEVPAGATTSETSHEYAIRMDGKIEINQCPSLGLCVAVLDLRTGTFVSSGEDRLLLGPGMFAPDSWEFTRTK